MLESLELSAALRLPITYSEQRRNGLVQQTMQLLELGPIAEATTDVLSVEQSKRLTIAVELVSNPLLVFCDEPTSGLDARAASIVMRGIRNVARSGRTVICTIHQPSAAIFSLFDDLLLMKRGGQVVFFGELGDESSRLIEYFESVPGTPSCPPDRAHPDKRMLTLQDSRRDGAQVRQSARMGTTPPRGCSR